MKASEVHDMFMAKGKWVDRDKTCDKFLHGSPETEITGIAVAWSPTNKAITEAARLGLNLFITHEPAFYEGFQRRKYPVEELVTEKKKLLDEHGISLLRSHDVWDRMPDYGIVDSWAAFLGFETENRPVESYYKICLLGDLTVAKTAEMIKEKVKPIGQNRVLVLGDLKKNVGRLAVGTGAITNLPEMKSLRADILLATEDGMNFWDGGLWAADAGLPVIIVNHATSEKPGMFSMQKYLSQLYPGIKVQYVDVEFPYSII
jgi:putative NIF3 family GTP cyclohydrolase 1 type 2